MITVYRGFFLQEPSTLSQYENFGSDTYERMARISKLQLQTLRCMNMVLHVFFLDTGGPSQSHRFLGSALLRTSCCCPLCDCISKGWITLEKLQTIPIIPIYILRCVPDCG